MSNGNGESVRKDFPEAGAVAWCKVAGPTVAPTGARFEWSVTVRGNTPSTLIKNIREFEALLVAHDCSPFDQYIDDRQAERRNQQATKPEPQNETNGSDPPSQGGQKSFVADEAVVAFTKAGQAYLKIKGGNFVKWGISMWPEAMEDAGINAEELDPRLPPKVKGLTATYEEWTTEDGQKRQKVVALN